MNKNRCDPRIFSDGSPIAAIDARSADVEDFVTKIARASGQRVDWHYSGGIAQVLCIGNREAVIAAIIRLEPELKGTILKIFNEDSAGLYRAGVSPSPRNAIAGFFDGDNTIFIIEEDE